MSINKQIVFGHLGADPELRTTANGTSVVNLSIATTYKGKDREEETTWHRCAAFGKRAEVIAKHCRKGEKIYVEGRTVARKYTDKEGVERYSHEVLVDDFDFGGGKGQRSSGLGDPSAPSNQDFDDDIPF